MLTGKGFSLEVAVVGCGNMCLLQKLTALGGACKVKEALLSLL
jgi:hypothetical protein